MQILQSPKDRFIYDSITLKNDLEALFIQNKDDSMAYVCLTVDVGSFKNGEVLGIAHFLEHMLFMGNSKYPEEDFYHKFITENGGSSNAYTAGTHTCYYFSIADHALEKGLDVFSGFFTSPLLKEDAVDREINAVNSEHEKNILNDMWRTEKILCTIQEDDCSFFNFHTGSNETLRIKDIHDKVTDFFHKYYSANIMKLAIMSKREISEQKELIKKYFSDIKNNNVIIDYDYNFVLKKSNIIKLVPVNNDNIMTIIWQVPESKYKIPEFITYLLNSQDKNSLITNLLNLNLAHFINVEIRADLPHFNLIIMTINLTDKGFQEKEKIYEYVYKYISLIKKTLLKNPEKIIDIYTDFKTVINNNFINWELDDNSEYIQQLCALWATKDIPVKDLISYEYTLPDIDKKLLMLIRNYFNKYFVIHEDNILLLSPDFKGLTNKKEKWYGIDYKLLPIENMKSNGFLTYSKLELPSKNPYILELKYEYQDCKEEARPELVISDEKYFDLFWNHSCKLNDTKTKVFIYFRLRDNLEIKDKIIINILLKCLLKQFSSDIYKFMTADYNTEIVLTNNSNYMIVSVYGYSEHMKNIIEFIIINLLNNANYSNIINTTLFEDVYNSIKIELHNLKNSPPYTKIINELCNEIIDDYYTEKEFLDYLKDHEITIENIIERNLLDDIIHYKVYVHGNMTKEEITSIFNKKIRLTKPKKEYKLIKINEDKYQEVIKRKLENKLEKNSAVALVFGLGYEKIGITHRWEYGRLFKMMFHMHLSMTFFDDLRTKQQLGYVARGIPGSIADIEEPFSIYSFVVQSDHKEPNILQERINKFIEKQKKYIDKLSDDQFKNLVNSIRDKLLEPYISLEEEANEYFNLLLTSNMTFNYREILLKILDTITKQDYIDYFTRVMNSNYIIIQISRNI
jgi:insulysin